MDTKNILVCVTQQKTCERLINAAYNMLKEHKGELFVINVVKNDVNFLDSPKESEALEYLFGISKSIGANLTVLKSDDVEGTIAKYAEENDIGLIIIGKSPVPNSENAFVRKLKYSLKKNIELQIVS